MNPALRRYLDKRASLAQRPLQGADIAGVRLVVAIPALAEFPGLLDTLSDLAQAPPKILAQTLVIVAVNHRAGAEDATRKNNRQTLEALARHPGPLRVGVVDAASPGCELDEKEGVGAARKMALDWGLAVLAENGMEQGGLVCLDADTRVDTAYLPALHTFFDGTGRWAAVLAYAHPLEGDGPGVEAILAYELFLRYHELGLTYARSPYAFPTIGSAMACTARAYAAVSGMNRRLAGEDFYFLQQLAKTGPVQRVDGTVVRPSARASHRVPFGTGQRVRRFLEEGDTGRFYHPESYRMLRAWLEAAQEEWNTDADHLMRRAQDIHPELAGFLRQQDLESIWPRLQREHRDPTRMRRAFHTWFDGFKTLKLMHHWRDHGFPEQPGPPALAQLLQWMGIPPEPELRALLQQTRQLCG